MTLADRNIEVRIKAQNGFEGGDVKIIRDLSMICNIKRLPSPSLDTCDIEIWNMLDEDANVLTTINYDPSKILKNTIEVYAGMRGVFSKVFEGDIVRGSLQYGGDSKFTASCQTNYFTGIKRIPPLSIKGREDLLNILSNLCGQSGLTLINRGVKGIFVTDPVLQGSAIDRIQELCQMTDVRLIMSDKDVIIEPQTAKSSGNVVLINADNGLISYPTLDELGVNVTVLFNRNILIGDTIQVESLNKKATGLWKVFEVHLSLSNLDTMWEMKVRGRLVR